MAVAVAAAEAARAVAGSVGGAESGMKLGTGIGGKRIETGPGESARAAAGVVLGRVETSPRAWMMRDSKRWPRRLRSE
jgi:hypothetical protein